MSARDHERALRYRKLALAETDKTKASLLNRIAEEAEQGLLCKVTRPYLASANYVEARR